MIIIWITVQRNYGGIDVSMIQSFITFI